MAIIKGDRIQTTLQGRTAHWPSYKNPAICTGTVTHTVNGKYPRVYVIWDGCHFEDEMFTHEVCKKEQ